LIDIIEAGGVHDAAILTQYAVRTRYPGAIEPISLEEYHTAMALAQQVLGWAETVVSGVEG
jgi:hypothetical protein